MRYMLLLLGLHKGLYYDPQKTLILESNKPHGPRKDGEATHTLADHTKVRLRNSLFFSQIFFPLPAGLG